MQYIGSTLGLSLLHTSAPKNKYVTLQPHGKSTPLWVIVFEETAQCFGDRYEHQVSKNDAENFTIVHTGVTFQYRIAHDIRGNPNNKNTIMVGGIRNIKSSAGELWGSHNPRLWSITENVENVNSNDLR